MSVFRTAMVWLGLVDDDEYDAQDDQYYLDDEYEEVPAAAAPAPTPARVAPARSAQTESPVTVFRGRNSRDEEYQRYTAHVALRQAQLATERGDAIAAHAAYDQARASYDRAQAARD